jgi:hypothetical protein
MNAAKKQDFTPFHEIFNCLLALPQGAALYLKKSL